MGIWGKVMLVAVIPAVAGCAAVDRTVLPETVGPAPTEKAINSEKGTLQVFSARQKRDLGIDAQIFFEGEGDDVLCNPAHTDYTIKNPEGQVVEHVRNARDDNDDQPTVVSLSSGLYQVEAQAKGIGPVNVRVEIKAGESTVVNLQGDWRRMAKPGKRGDFVWLYNREIVGWRADVAQHAATTTQPPTRMTVSGVVDSATR